MSIARMPDGTIMWEGQIRIPVHRPEDDGLIIFAQLNPVLDVKRDTTQRDIVDQIDELVDEQLANYPNRSGYDYNVNQERCPHCRRHWHGLPITERIDSMYRRGEYDEAYSLEKDDSRILCQGSDFIGPMPSEHGVTCTPFSPNSSPGWAVVGTLTDDGLRWRDWGQQRAVFVEVRSVDGSWHRELILEDETSPPRDPPEHRPRDNEPPSFGGPTAQADAARQALVERLRELQGAR